MISGYGFTSGSLHTASAGQRSLTFLEPWACLSRPTCRNVDCERRRPPVDLGMSRREDRLVWRACEPVSGSALQHGLSVGGECGRRSGRGTRGVPERLSITFGVQRRLAVFYVVVPHRDQHCHQHEAEAARVVAADDRIGERRNYRAGGSVGRDATWANAGDGGG